MIPGVAVVLVTLLFAVDATGLPETVIAYVLAVGALIGALTAILKGLGWLGKVLAGIQELVDAMKGDGNGEPGLLKRTENAAALARAAKAAAETTHQLAEETHALAKANGEVSQSILVRLDSGDERFRKIEDILQILQDEDTRRVKRALDAAGGRRHPNRAEPPAVERRKP